jgi:hypothetical protein
MSVHYLPYGLPEEKGEAPVVTCKVLDPRLNATTVPADVTCSDCRRMIGLPSRREMQRRAWTVACVGGDTDLGFAEWMREVGVGASTPKKLHTPPYLNENDDGLFTFHDVHIEGCAFEVVPQTTGNVELTIEYDGDEHLFTLHHSDRADLLRALLHDFHYSPEKDGPHDN